MQLHEAIRKGRPEFKLPIWWVAGFFFVLVIGGLSRVILGSVPVDGQLHDTLFIVGHFHHVLTVGAMFPIFGALYFWLPKMWGRTMNERLGKWNFWLFFLGFNLIFTMPFLGLRVMARRSYTYLPEMTFRWLNLVAIVGVLLMAAGGLVFIANFFWSRRNGLMAGPNRWTAESPECATPSPPQAQRKSAELPTVNEAGELDLGREIIEYVRRNPDARDTTQGIARWWLRDSAGLNLDVLEKVLRGLCSQGILKEVQSGSQVMFALAKLPPTESDE